MNQFDQYISTAAPGHPVHPPSRTLPTVGEVAVRPNGLRRETHAALSPNAQQRTQYKKGISLTGNEDKSYKSLSKRELLTIITRLTIMLRSGVDLADAVRSISLRGGSARIEQAMRCLYSSLEAGKSLSQALEAQRHQFGGTLVASAAAGEASGKLIEVLSRLTQILKDDLRLQNSIRSTLSYPVVLFFVTLLVMSAMLFFVLPQFGGIYESAGAVVPPWTAIMLDISQLSRKYWWGLFLLVGLLLLVCGYTIQTPMGRNKLDRLSCKHPC